MYDPFHVGEDGDPSAREKKLIMVRHPPLFDGPLHTMEWKPTGGEASRKRRRPSGPGPEQREEQDVVERKEVTAKVEAKKAEGEMETVTIMGGPPLVDDRVRYVVNFMLEHVKSDKVEVEAKLGVLFEKVENVRAVTLVPVLCETPIRSESNKDTRFQSDVGAETFARLNARLNQRVDRTSENAPGNVRYIRRREMDVFWPGKIRETKERREGGEGGDGYHTIRVQRKTRLGDLNVLCPGRRADVRYSASEEMDCGIPTGCEPTMQRVKDRMSYKYEYLSVDITCVQMQGVGEKSTMTFEVEVEVDSSANLYSEVVKFRNGDGSSKVFAIAFSMVNTVRLLLE